MGSRMREISRRGLLGAGLGVGAAAGVAGCSTAGSSGAGAGDGSPSPDKGATGHKAAGGTSKGSGTKKDVRAIGDGSTADTGKQPKQPQAPVPLEPGQKPPQFVIFSWDG